MLSKYNNNNNNIIITLALYKIFTIINRSTFIIIVLAIIKILFYNNIHYKHYQIINQFRNPTTTLNTNRS